MAEKQLSVEALLGLLAETPVRIAAATAGAARAQLHSRPGPDEWSVNEVLAHLRSCADVWGGSIAVILAGDHPVIRASSPRAEVNRKNYPELDFKKSFGSFARQRADLLAVLEGLTQDGWSRGATVTGAGKPLELTVLSFAQRLAVHERAHVKQIERTVKSSPTAK